MPRRRPAIMLYKGDWRKDPELSMCSPAARGIWMDLLIAMDDAEQPGRLSGTVTQLSRVARCTPEEMAEALAELAVTRTADVTGCNGENVTCNSHVTVENRRMRREAQEREKTRLRVAKHRRKRASKADVTPEVTPPSSVAVARTTYDEQKTDDRPTPHPPTHGRLSPESSGDLLPGITANGNGHQAGRAPAIRRIFEAYVTAWEQHRKRRSQHTGPKPKLTPKRERLISSRLREGYSEKHLAAAAEGHFCSEWNTGKNPEAKEFLSPELCFRDGEHVERYAEEFLRAKSGRGGMRAETEEEERRGFHGTIGPSGTTRWSMHRECWLPKDEWEREEAEHAAH